MLKASHKQRGDTIVEVLIAIAVVSFTLAAAYVSVSRSANGTRTAQERSVATKWAEQQVERLKVDPIEHLVGDPNFCYNEGSGSASPGPCYHNDGINYLAVIKAVGSSPTTNNVTYQVLITWDAIGAADASGQNKVELDYTK